MADNPDNSRWLDRGKLLWALLALVVIGPVAGYVWTQVLDDREEKSKQKDPVEVTVQADPKVFEEGTPDWTGYAYVVEGAAAEVPDPPPGECRDRREWALGLDAADADFTRLRVSLSGRPQAPVRIDDVRVVVHERRSTRSSPGRRRS